MKKVILFNMSLHRGGAERVTVYIAKHLVVSGYECDIITTQIHKNEYDLPLGVNRICLKSKNKLGQIFEMRKILKSSQADVVLSMGVSNSLFVIPAAMGLKTKVIVSERNDPRHPTGKAIINKIARALMKRADGFVFQTNEAKEFYSKKLRGRGKVIFNPLPLENFPDAYFGEREKSIVSVGRLANQKNQKMLIDAFAQIAPKHPEYKLEIYGEGPLRAELESQVESLNLGERVLLPGNITNVHEVIKTKAVFALPSDFEGMPNALIEAMALGLPCVSTDCPCGGPRELISNGENGVLVSVGNANEMAEALDKLITNHDYANTLGKNAVNVRELLDAEIIGEQWISYFEEVCVSKG